MVRVLVSDNREYLGNAPELTNVGRLASVDKQKALFLMDAMEILDKDAPDYFAHDLYTPHLLKNQKEDQRKVFRFIGNLRILSVLGNIVIPGQHVKRILLDKIYEKEFREKL